MRKIAFSVAFFLASLVAVTVAAQQVADDSYQPIDLDPLYEQGEGPLVLIDDGHNNFHTKDGRYQPFAILLEADGYRVEAQRGRIRTSSLAEAKVLVISNALDNRNVRSWTLPTPSAFTDREIETVVEFVDSGGSLFLIADHMPFPGAAGELAAQFGMSFENGFAFELDQAGRQSQRPTVFRRADGRIGEHPITRGRTELEVITQVQSFTGSAFQIQGAGRSLIRFGDNAVMLSPSQAWQFDEQTSNFPIGGWSQGAATEKGDGRVVVFGEAAMFSSQTTQGGGRMGMTSPQATDNQQLLLNIIHWLSFEI